METVVANITEVVETVTAEIEEVVESVEALVHDASIKRMVRHAVSNQFVFIGKAPLGSAEDAEVWTIYRIETDLDGTVVAILKATGVKWTDYLTETYS